MNVLQSFTVSTMKVHKKWTIVTVLGVIISAAMLSGVTTFTASFMDLLQRQEISDYGKWTAHFKYVPASDAAAWKDASSGNDVMMQKEIGFAPLDRSRNAAKPYLYVSQFDEASFSNFFIKTTSGRLPVNDREIVLPDEIKDSAGVHYSIGDTVTLQLGNRMFPDGIPAPSDSSYTKEYYSYDEKTGRSTDMGPESLSVTGTQTYTIVGFISPAITESFWSAGYSCFTAFPVSKPAAVVSSAGGNVDLYLWNQKTALNYYSQIRGQAAAMGYSSDQIQFNDAYLRYCAVTDSGNGQDLMFTLVFVIVGIIIIASVSLIYNAFSISVSERTRHLGLLASAGATRKQKRVHVHFEGFLVGMMGIPLGILFGILGIKFTFLLIQPIFASVTEWNNIEIHTIVSGWTIGITVLLSAATVYVSVLIPAIRASRIMPIDAIRQSREIKLTSRSVRTSPLFRRFFGFEAELAMKNFRRSRRKYRATIISLVISLVLFLTVSSYVQFGTMYAQSSAEQIDYDIYFSIDNISQAERNNVVDQIAALPGTKSIATVSSEGMFLISESDIRTSISKDSQNTGGTTYVTLSSYDDESFAGYARSLGENPDDYLNPENPRGILINYAVEYNYDTGKKMIGDVLSIAQGSTLTAGYYTDTSYPAEKGAEPASDIVSTDFTIGKITQELPVGITYDSFSNVTLIIPESLHAALVSKAGTADNAVYPATFIRTDDSKELEQQIREITKTIPASQTSLYNVSSAREQDQKTTFLLGVFVYGFITLISLICIANIFNTITTNVALRQKEFAMLRSVGMTPASFNRMIRFESVFYGFKALILGLPISMLISYFLYKREMYVYTFAFSLPWLSYLVAIFLVFVLVFTTMLYSVSRVNKTNIVDTLKMDTM
ncbi:MAG: FtsX-like permease family protein [Eubacteriales bacterium]